MTEKRRPSFQTASIRKLPARPPPPFGLTRATSSTNDLTSLNGPVPPSGRPAPLPRSKSEHILNNQRLSIPKKQGQVSRILTEVGASYSLYHDLPDMIPVTPPSKEHQQEATNRLYSKGSSSLGLNETEREMLSKMCMSILESRMSENMGPLKTKEEQAEYMEKLAQPARPETPVRIKREKEEEKKRREEEERRKRSKEFAQKEKERNLLEKERREQEKRERRLVLEQNYGLLPHGDGSRSRRETILGLAQEGQWDAVLNGIDVLENKFGIERVPLSGIDPPGSRPRSAKSNVTPITFTPYGESCGGALDELCWVLILSLQGAHILKNGERLENLLLDDVTPLLRKAKGVPRLPGTIRRLQSLAPKLARGLQFIQGVPGDGLKEELEQCRNDLLRKEYVASAMLQAQHYMNEKG